jgi:hypothetical protein
MDTKELDTMLIEAMALSTRTGQPWEEINSVEKACDHLGEDNPIVKAYRNIADIDDAQFKAMVALRVVADALNTFVEHQEQEYFYPRFWCYNIDTMDYIEQLDKRIIKLTNFETRCGYLGYCRVDSNHTGMAGSSMPRQLSVNSPELAKYMGKTFIGLFREYLYNFKQSQQ